MINRLTWRMPRRGETRSVRRSTGLFPQEVDLTGRGSQEPLEASMHSPYRAALVGAVIVLGGSLADAATLQPGDSKAKAKSKISAAGVQHWEGTLKVRPGTQL